MRSNCLSEQELLAFHVGTLPNDAIDAAAEHLEACTHCATLLQRLDNSPDPVLAVLRLVGTLPSTWRSGEEAREGPQGQPLLPGYDVFAPLGRGGMGVVYKARHRRLDRLVALKRLRSEGPRALARSRHEAETLARLQHPNIVQIHEIIEHEGATYLALELVEGGTLEATLAGKPQPPRDAAHLVEVIARAVHFAHEHGIIHRDLKPANVLLSGLAKPQAADEGAACGLAGHVPKITDFGIAKRLAVDLGETQEGDVIGTPSYMSPEQAAGKVEAIGPASDVYSLGVILYECLTGRVPIQGPTPLDTLILVMSADLVPPRRLQPRTPRDLETICLKCLEKQPRARYASALDLADDLAAFQAGRPVKARPASAGERALKWARRRPAVAGLLGLVLLIGLAAFALVSWQWREALHQKGLADLRAESEATAKEQAREAQHRAEVEKDNALTQLYRAQTTQYALRIAAAQAEVRGGNFTRAQQILAGCSERLRGWEYEHVLATCTNRSRHLGPIRGDSASLAFDPKGDFLAIGTMDGLVVVWDVRASRRAFKFQGGPGGFSVLSVAYSSDGKYLATASRDGRARTWSAADGKLVRTFGAPANQQRMTGRVAFSPDGARLTATFTEFVERWADVFVWDAATGRQLSGKRKLRGEREVTESLDGRRQARVEAGMVRVCDAKWRPTHALRAPGVLVRDLLFSPDGKRLAGHASDGTVRVWDVEQQKLLASFPSQNERFARLAFSPDGKRIAWGSPDAVAGVTVWDVDTGGEAFTLRGHNRAFHAVAIGPNGEHVASSGIDGVTLWNLRPDRALTLLVCTDPRYGIAFSPDSQRLASVGHAGNLELWDLARGTLLPLGHGIGGPPLAGVAYSPDGRAVATACSNGEAKVWGLVVPGVLAVFPGHKGGASAVAYRPDGKVLAVADRDGGTRLWDLARGRTLRHLSRQAAPARCVAFSHDGKRLASGGGDGKVTVWDARTGEVITTWRGHRGPITGVAFAPPRQDGERKDLPPSTFLLPANADVLASASADGTARLWDLGASKELLTLQGHTGPVNALGFSPDGRRLATGGADRSVQLWDVTTGLVVCVLTGHPQPVDCVAFSPDGRRLASTGSDKVGFDRTIRIWNALAPAR